MINSMPHSSGLSSPFGIGRAREREQNTGLVTNSLALILPIDYTIHGRNNDEDGKEKISLPNLEGILDLFLLDEDRRRWNAKEERQF